MIKIKRWWYQNHGEVIVVKKFEEFIKETGFSVCLCKGYDPSTKGKFEKTVDFEMIHDITNNSRG